MLTWSGGAGLHGHRREHGGPQGDTRLGHGVFPGPEAHGADKDHEPQLRADPRGAYAEFVRSAAGLSPQAVSAWCS